MKIAVTGGSGRIGRFVVQELLSRGHQVVNLDRRAPRDAGARFVYVDMRNREQVQPILEGTDAVIHLAEITHQSAPFSSDEIYSHNTRVAAVVMQSAADLKLRRAIYTSTAQVYGCWDHPKLPPLSVPMDETHPLRPMNVYSLSKVSNESYCQWLAKASGLSIAIFRLPWVVDFELEEHHWERFTHRGHGSFDGMGTYVHATDVARAYALAIETPRPGCEAYHLTAPEVGLLRPLREFWEKAEGFPPLPENWPAYKSPVSTAKAREHFGWEAKWNLLDFYRKRFGKDPA